MRMCVIVPTTAYLKQAGVRIRYQRLAEYLYDKGVVIELKPIEEFTSRAELTNYDAYIISKCYDARAHLIAQALHGHKKVIVDLFDDYFTQSQDSRLARLRLWLKQISLYTDMFLCSTEGMAEVAKIYAGKTTVHVLNDPASEIDKESITHLLNAKLSVLNHTRVIKACWFGMGDNPNFEVGLQDLVAQGNQLNQLAVDGYQLDFTILTNQRALTEANLALLRLLPFEFTIEEWSETKEKELLKQSLLCLLPVNAQNFSIVKSLNRVVTALSHGCQVLSLGFPLYQPFNDYIYRTPHEWSADVYNADFNMSADTVEGLINVLNQFASIEQEAESFIEQLNKVTLAENNKMNSQSTILVHGMDSSPANHKLVQKLGGLSVASPFCRHKLNFDIRFEWSEEKQQFECHVCEKTLLKLSDSVRSRAVKVGKKIHRVYYALPPLTRIEHSFIHFSGWTDSTKLVQLSCYNQIMHWLNCYLTDYFPEMNVILSEQSKSAFWIKN